jgi:hypothetical protein
MIGQMSDQTQAFTRGIELNMQLKTLILKR